MVLPHKEPLAPDLKRALERLGIELMRFKLSHDEAIIFNRAAAVAIDKLTLLGEL